MLEGFFNEGLNAEPGVAKAKSMMKMNYKAQKIRFIYRNQGVMYDYAEKAMSQVPVRLACRKYARRIITCIK